MAKPSIIASKTLTESELINLAQSIHANQPFLYFLLEKYGEIELERYPKNFSLKHCYRGRFFGQTTEIQFRLKGEQYITLLISDAPNLTPPPGFQQVPNLTAYDSCPQWVYIWGEYLDSNLWYQQRIPKLIEYPIQQINPQRKYVQLLVYEYLHNASVEFVRFADFKQVD